MLILIGSLEKAVASGNDSEVTKITEELIASIQMFIPQLPPKLQKFFTFFTLELKGIPQLLHTGNKSGVIAIIALGRNTLAELVSNKGLDGGEDVDGGKGTATGSKSMK